MIARLFSSPSISYRLFDPMPLPKTKRDRSAGRLLSPKKRIISAKVLFRTGIKKIPANR